MLLTGSHEVVSRKERNELKRKHLVSKFFQSAGQLKYLFIFELFRSVNPGANFCIFNFVSENVARV